MTDLDFLLLQVSDQLVNCKLADSLAFVSLPEVDSVFIEFLLSDDCNVIEVAQLGISDFLIQGSITKIAFCVESE